MTESFHADAVVVRIDPTPACAPDSDQSIDYGYSVGAIEAD
jgi:hypothetical protein